MARSLVAIVEDETNLRNALVEYLELNGFDAVGLAGGSALRTLLAERVPEVVILDIALPGEDGLALCRFVRREHRTGIIMATAAGTPLDRIVGLELGADDYLVKPYDLRELVARVRSVIRRGSGDAAPAPSSSQAEQGAPDRTDGGFHLDATTRVVVNGRGVEVPLTAMEFNLLQAMAGRPGHAFSRERLAELVHGRQVGGDARSIDIQVTRLRKKLEADPSKPQIIQTVRGVGYTYLPVHASK